MLNELLLILARIYISYNNKKIIVIWLILAFQFYLFGYIMKYLVKQI